MTSTDSAIYLLRHGQTEWSATGRHTSTSEVGLTEEGEQQARLAGGVLSALRATTVPPAKVICSPRDRAVRTAQLAGLTVDERDEQLAEWNYGEYEGLTTEQIQEKVPNWTVWSHPVPGGESVHDVHKRARSIVESARSILPRGDVVLIGHGHFLRVVVATWLGGEPGDGVRYALDPAAVTVLGHERGVEQIRALNVLPIEGEASDGESGEGLGLLAE